MGSGPSIMTASLASLCASHNWYNMVHISSNSFELILLKQSNSHPFKSSWRPVGLGCLTTATTTTKSPISEMSVDIAKICFFVFLENWFSLAFKKGLEVALVYFFFRFV
jgi:hypothetical protein